MNKVKLLSEVLISLLREEILFKIVNLYEIRVCTISVLLCLCVSDIIKKVFGNVQESKSYYTRVKRPRFKRSRIHHSIEV